MHAARTTYSQREAAQKSAQRRQRQGNGLEERANADRLRSLFVVVNVHQIDAARSTLEQKDHPSHGQVAQAG